MRFSHQRPSFDTGGKVVPCSCTCKDVIDAIGLVDEHVEELCVRSGFRGNFLPIHIVFSLECYVRRERTMSMHDVEQLTSAVFSLTHGHSIELREAVKQFVEGGIGNLLSSGLEGRHASRQGQPNEFNEWLDAFWAELWRKGD